MTRSTVEIFGVDADPGADDAPPAAPVAEAEDAGLPPAALPAPPLVAPVVDILSELVYFFIVKKYFSN